MEFCRIASTLCLVLSLLLPPVNAESIEPSTVAAKDSPTKSWKFKNEEEFIVDSICRDIAQIILLGEKVAKADSAVDPQSVKLSLTQQNQETENYAVSIENPALEKAISKNFQLQGSIFTEENYAPLADELLHALNRSAETASQLQSEKEFLTKLAAFNATDFIDADKSVAKALTKQPFCPELHERAALVVGCFILRDLSGEFHDLKSSYCRMCAHLAIAKALRANHDYSLTGKIASVLLPGITSRDTETVERAQVLAGEVTDPIASSWVRTLNIIGTNDYRNLGKTDATQIERIEYAQRLAFFVNADAVAKYIGSLNQPYSIEWMRIGQNGQQTVGSGHVFMHHAFNSEMDDFFTDYKLWHGRSFVDMYALSSELSKRPTLCLVQDGGAWELQPISWPDLANCHGRLILNGWLRSYHFCARMWGEPEESKRILDSGKKTLANLRLYPLCLTDLPFDPDEKSKLLLRVQQLIDVSPESVAPYVWQAINKEYHSQIPLPSRWFGELPPFGTAMCFPFYEAQDSKKLDLPTLERYRKLAIYNRYVCEKYTLKKYGAHPTSQEWDEGFGKMKEFDIYAIRTAAEAAQSQPADIIPRLEQAAKIDPLCWGELANYCWHRNRPADTLKYLETAMKVGIDPLWLAASAGWLTDYYLEHGEAKKAKAVAHVAYEVYSDAGLQNYARYLEKVGLYWDEEDTLKRLKERYGEERQLQGFYVRHMKDGPTYKAKAEAYLAKVAPEGWHKSGAKLPQSPPSRGALVTRESAISKLAGIKAGDIVVSVNGYDTHNMKQYFLAREMAPGDKVDVVFWDGHSYRKQTVRAMNGQIGYVITDYPTIANEKPNAKAAPTAQAGSTGTTGGVATAAVSPTTKAASKSLPSVNFTRAVQLFNQHKYNEATALLNKMVQSGKADDATRAYLAAAYENDRQYKNAIASYEALAAASADYAVKTKAKSEASRLRKAVAGICPNNCLKLSEGVWAHYPGLDETVLWRKFAFSGGWNAWSTRHLGEVIEYDDGVPVNKGKCPVCNGTGKVPPLR